MQEPGDKIISSDKQCLRADMAQSMAVYALTPQGAKLGTLIASKLSGVLFLPRRLAPASGARSFESIMEAVAKQFFCFRAHVFITAAGIAVRAIAAHIQDKQSDPAVVVLDQKGEYVISLLSGHLGRANELALSIADITRGQAVITTATDCLGLPALDVLAQEQGLYINDMQALRQVSAALLRKEKVQLYDTQKRLALSGEQRKNFIEIKESTQWSPDSPGVRVDWQQPELNPNQLLLHPACLLAGIGCNRDTSCAEILDLVHKTFAEHKLALKSLAGIASIQEKSDEQGLLQAAEELGVQLSFYPAAELKEICTPSPSQMVFSHMGVYSVCEAAACKLAGSDHLVVHKVKSTNVTLAIGLSGSCAER